MATIIPIRQYQVLITPLIDKDVYGDVVDVTKDIDLSDYIKQGGIGSIKRDVDNGDYDFGVFTYGDITIKAFNINGQFNDENDWRSIFPYSRDKAKVLVNFLDVSGSTLISFNGIINEEGTRQDFSKDEVKFKILSEDSVIRKTKVAGGLVASGSSFSTAIKSIINVPEITSVLTYDALKINVGLDLDIDVATWFDNKTTKEALDLLMVASNSVMTIEDSTMIVRTREENSGSAFNLYGHGDLFGRENILNIKNYNTGLHRSFNSIVVNDFEVSNQELIETYNMRQKNIDIGFITDNDKESQIATKLLSEFSSPKTEMEIVTTTETAKGLNLFDLISVDYPYRVTPHELSDTLPLFGSAKFGESVFPRIQGNLKIDPRFAFKVIGIKENPKNFTTTLKIRQRGTTISDGLFSSFTTLFGSAVFGESLFKEDIDRIDPNITSVFGAGLFGTVLFRS